MKLKSIYVVLLLILSFSLEGFSQCKQTMTINSYNSECNGDGTSAVDINVTILFGNGNNSVTISYDIGAGSVNAVVLEDDDGDIIDQDYMFLVPSCDNYTVSVTAWTNPSGSGSSCSDPPPIIAPIILPVTFGDFDLKLDRSSVDVIWSTYSEINNERFEIQRASNDEDFITVGTVAGSSNSYGLKQYIFEDKLIESGKYFYRIKQVDLDDQFSFSEIREVNYSEKSNITISPNPADNFISISSLSHKQFHIYNAFGMFVKTIEMIDDKIEIDISGLDNGLYLLMSSDKKEVRKFVKH